MTRTSANSKILSIRNLHVHVLDQRLIEVIRLNFIIQGAFSLHSQSDICCCNLCFLATDVELYLADLGLLISRNLFYFFEIKNACKCRCKSVNIESLPTFLPRFPPNATRTGCPIQILSRLSLDTCRFQKIPPHQRNVTFLYPILLAH